MDQKFVLYCVKVVPIDLRGIKYVIRQHNFILDEGILQIHVKRALLSTVYEEYLISSMSDFGQTLFVGISFVKQVLDLRP